MSKIEPSSDKLATPSSDAGVSAGPGDSEKQLAARVGLSQATVHQYVTALYRYFGVRIALSSLSLALQRIGRTARASQGRSTPLQPFQHIC